MALAAGCTRAPDIYAPPIERRPIDTIQPEPEAFVAMGDPRAGWHILADIGDGVQAGAWRWTAQKPALQFRVPGQGALKAVVEFSIAETTFRQTGPVTIAFQVNGQLLDRVRYDTSGEKRFEKAVPRELLRRRDPVILAMEIDPVYVSPTDGVRLGVILSRAGFRR